MQVRVFQCIVAGLERFRKPSRIAWSGVLFVLAGASAAQTISSVVTPAEQSTRDDERVRILRDELKKAEALIESLGKRKAERLAVADTVGADEAEQSRIRTVSDIAGLKREIAAARPGVNVPRATVSVASASVSVKPASQPKLLPAAPWWDVYSKARRNDASASASAPAPVSFTQPATGEARSLPASKPE